MNHIKIIFFDIDGTLIGLNKTTLSPTMTETLQELKRRGILLCIATGRPYDSIPRFPNVTFDAFLSFNGSYCRTKDTVLYQQPIPSTDVHTIIKNASAIHRPVVLAGIHRMGANGVDQDLIDYFAISNQQVTLIDDFNSFAKQDIYEMMLGCTPQDYPNILQGVHGARITSWWSRAADIIPENGGKGVGIAHVLAHYRLRKEEALAFGDGTNDIEMLQAVGTGVAMGNASEDVKAIADDVCDSVDEEGITTYCRQHGLL